MTDSWPRTGCIGSLPTVDAAGWRPTQGEVDRYGREIPDSEYGTPDFERTRSR